jgi:hypothetical protein
MDIPFPVVTCGHYLVGLASLLAFSRSCRLMPRYGLWCSSLSASVLTFFFLLHFMFYLWAQSVASLLDMCSWSTGWDTPGCLGAWWYGEKLCPLRRTMEENAWVVFAIGTVRRLTLMYNIVGNGARQMGFKAVATFLELRTKMSFTYRTRLK